MIKMRKSNKWWLDIILLWVAQFVWFLGRVRDELKVKATQPEACVMAVMLTVILPHYVYKQCWFKFQM